MSAEAGYHGLVQGESPAAWAAKPTEITDDKVYVDGHPVMEGWELPYQKAIAKVATSKGGKVLEVGFGMALSATAIQTHDIDEHVIIEANDDVFKKLQVWATKQKHKVTPLKGLWQDVVKTLPDDDFDGIYYDTYPNNEESQHIHQFEFIRQARRIMKQGAVLTYCNLTSLGVLRPRYTKEGVTDAQAWATLFEETQEQQLIDSGFDEKEILDYEIFGPLSPDATCEYYQHTTLLIPRIEKLSGYNKLVKGESPAAWAAKPTEITDDKVYVDGHPVMEGWELPYQKAIAKVATSKGGKVLEVGFGMALSATAIQTHDIDEHVIIEANDDVFKKLQVWATKQKHKVTPLKGLWQDVVKTLPDDDFDGIYYDTYPNNEESQHIHQFEFIRQARRIMKQGAVLTYCNLTSLGVLRPRYTKEGVTDAQAWATLFEETQKQQLIDAGFDEKEVLDYEIFGPLSPDATCEYYQHTTLLIPRIEKLSGYNKLVKGESPAAWAAKPTEITDDKVYVDGHPVMEGWELPYQKAIAKVATSKGGKVLEVGFGMALSATAIQTHDIDEHVIIEANDDVFKKLQVWATEQKHKVTPLKGLWQDVVKTLPDDDFDGIYYDTYPNNEESQHIHQFEFIRQARRIMKQGAVLTYCNLTSLGVLRPRYTKEGVTDAQAWATLFEETQKQQLIDSGFDEKEILDYEIFGPLSPDATCEYYQHTTLLIPRIEKLSGYNKLVKGESPAAWAAKPTEITDDKVYVDGHPVMEGWELPYQKAIAKVATSKGGKVLEVGFGMALSATAIQTHDIDEHVIIEANDDVFKKLQVWATKQKHKVTPLKGLWQDVVKTLPDDDFDGIYYDTYPNNEESQHIHQFEFIRQARRIMKQGAVLTYCNLTSLGVLRPRYTKEGVTDAQAWATLFEETQKQQLIDAGFDEKEVLDYEIFGPLSPDATCEYYQHTTLLIPRIEKLSGYNKLVKGESPAAWAAKPTEITDDKVYVDGHPVMEGWELPYQKAIAKVATSKGGKVLEVGFGMALSATAIQTHDIDEHVIIEANDDVFKKLQVWATEQKHKVTPLKGLWQDVVKTLPDDDFDGIYYDTYPNNEESQHIHQFEFIRQARRIMKQGAVLTYCNLTSLGVLRPRYTKEGVTDAQAWATLFEETQKQQLIDSGFDEKEILDYEIFGPLSPDATCEYYQHTTLLIPRIEKLSGYNKLVKGESPAAWAAKPTEITDDKVYVDGHPVMEGWELPYQKAIAKVATSKGGKVLEVGFGMALSATAIQTHDIDEHVIIEANDDVFKKLQVWATKQKHKVTPLKGLWQDVVKTLPDDDFDGIYYDTYPNNEESQHIHQFEFIRQARRIMKQGAVLTYCNLTSLGVLRPRYTKEGVTDAQAWATLFEETQKQQLIDAGFDEKEVLDYEIFGPLSPDATCEYYQHTTLLIPRIEKLSGYNKLVKGESPAAWAAKPTEITDDKVYVDGHPVMEGWELPYQKAIAKVATSKGGKVLEVGFGMALSATAIQTHDIDEHVIIEANDDVFKKLQVWATKQKHKVTPLKGLWQDVVKTLPDDDFDGIYYDTYPNNEESQHIHQFEFIRQARRIMKQGAVLTYCNLTSLGVLRPRYTRLGVTDAEAWATLFEETQKQQLIDSGFEEDEIRDYEIFGPLAPPTTCDYYQVCTLPSQKLHFTTLFHYFPTHTTFIIGPNMGHHFGLFDNNVTFFDTTLTTGLCISRRPFFYLFIPTLSSPRFSQ